jgi:hypothetical protein
MKISSLTVAVIAALALGANVARADIAPADACTSPGQPCQNAGPSYDQAGVCTAATCTKTIYNGPGDLTTMQYACNQCQPAGGAGGSNGGAGGTSTATGGVGGTSGETGGAGGTSQGAAGASAGASGEAGGAGGHPVLGGPSKVVTKSSGCAVGGSGDGASAAVLLLLALVLARRARTNG